MARKLVSCPTQGKSASPSRLYHKRGEQAGIHTFGHGAVQTPVSGVIGNEGKLRLLTCPNERSITPGLAAGNIVVERLPDMAVDMERLVKGGAIIHFEDTRVTPLEGLRRRGPEP